jgi:hypothetical protein
VCDRCGLSRLLIGWFADAEGDGRLQQKLLALLEVMALPLVKSLEDSMAWVQGGPGGAAIAWIKEAGLGGLAHA